MGCKDVPEILASGTADRASVYRNIFGENVSARRRETTAVFDTLSRFGIGDETSNRIDAMLDAGWIDEVRALMGHVPPDAPAWNACGYREIRDVVEGRTTLDEARQAILISTRQYAKRQRTWFRHQLGAEDEVTRMDPRAADAADIAEQWFTGRARA